MAASSVLLPATLLIDDAGHLGVAGSVVAAIGLAYWAWTTAFWARRWPSVRQSQVLVLMGACDVVGWTLVQPSAKAAALGCTALAVTGAYLAFFHTVKLIAANAAAAAIASAVAAIRIVDDEAALMVAYLWVSCLIVVAVPGGIRALAHAMHFHAGNSRRDALTGLLNRRGFNDAYSATMGAVEHGHINLLFVDLDNFKRLNDTRGHAVGDQALVAVAELLLNHLPGAIVARVGGEEFVASHLVAGHELHPSVDRFRVAIAALPYNVTASIGSATLNVSAVDTATTVDILVAEADQAMYVAKRNGGNQIRHTVHHLGKSIPPVE